MFPLVLTHRLQNTWEVLVLCLVQDNLPLVVVGSLPLVVVDSLPLVVVGNLPLVAEGHLLEDNSLPLVVNSFLRCPLPQDNSLPLVVNSFLRCPLPQDNSLYSLRNPQRHLAAYQGGKGTQHSPQLRNHGNLLP